MINSLCGSVGTLKSENSSSSIKLHPASPNESSISETKKTSQSSDSVQPNSLTPPSLNFPPLKFEIDGDVEVQSPDCSIWETFFSDHLDGDFMISSPVRNLPSPRTSAYNNNYNYNYAQSMQGQSLSGCSPPRFSAQVGAFSSSLRAKGQSPLHKVFNSPGSQYMQPENLALTTAIEDFLDDYQKDGYGMFSPMKICGGDGSGSSPQLLDIPTTVPAMLECLAMPNNNPSRFGGSVSESSSTAGASQLSDDKDIYQMGSVATAPLSQQLQQEQLQESQQPQQQQQNLNHSLMAPLPITSEQVKNFP